MDRFDALDAVEAELRRHNVDSAAVFERWGAACPLFDMADVARVSEVPGWVHCLHRDEAETVLRSLVGLAQDGDEAALLAVVVCLRPGLAAMGRRWGRSMEDLIGEVVVRVLELPLERRRNIPAGLLLDVRKQLWLEEKTRSAEQPTAEVANRVGDDAWPLVLDNYFSQTDPLSEDVLLGTGAGEGVLRLVEHAWAAGELADDEARLVLETRVFGDTLQIAGARRGIGESGVGERRSRIEHRLASHAEHICPGVAA